MPSVRFLCEDRSQDTDNPRLSLYIVVNEHKTKLGDLQACQPINANEYAGLGIPAEAIAAAGGRWSGSGNYYFAQMAGPGKVVFYFREVTETQDAPEVPFRPVARFENGRFYFQE